MNAEKRRSLKTPFILDAARLRELDDLLGQVNQPRKYEVTDQSDLMLYASDVESLIHQISAKNIAIYQLEITTPLEERPNVRMILGKSVSHDQSTVYYAVMGNESEVPYLDNQLSGWLRESRPWYSWLINMDAIVSLSGILVVSALVVTGLVGLAYLWLTAQGIVIPTTLGTVSQNVALTIGGFVLIVILIAAAVLRFLRTRLFPMVTIALGQGLRHHERIVQIRQTLWLSLAVIFTLLCGIFVNAITR